MKYFTQKLFIDYNSHNDEIADRADEQWDKAESQYKEHLEKIRSRMPEPIRELSRSCFHDADILSRQTIHQPNVIDAPCSLALPLWSALEVITLRQGDEIISLFYTLADHVRTIPAPKAWTFAKGQEIWLYDEVDVEDGERRPPRYLHRILLSSGVVLEIPFVSVLIHKVALAVPAEMTV